MPHFAQLDESNTVLRVIVADSQEWCVQNLGGRWLQTSYNTSGGVHIQGGTAFRKNYAGSGYTYDEARDAFIPPQPFPSWTLNEESCNWEPPTPKPEGLYVWDEASLAWVLSA